MLTRHLTWRVSYALARSSVVLAPVPVAEPRGTEVPGEERPGRRGGALHTERPPLANPRRRRARRPALPAGRRARSKRLDRPRDREDPPGRGASRRRDRSYHRRQKRVRGIPGGRHGPGDERPGGGQRARWAGTHRRRPALPGGAHPGEHAVRARRRDRRLAGRARPRRGRGRGRATQRLSLQRPRGREPRHLGRGVRPAGRRGGRVLGRRPRQLGRRGGYRARVARRLAVRAPLRLPR